MQCFEGLPSFPVLFSPLIFNNICLLQFPQSHSLFPACKRVRDLCTLIEAGSDLSRWCKSFAFNLLDKVPQHGKEYPNSVPTAYLVGSKLLKSLSNLRTLEIYGGFGDQVSWQSLRTSMHFMHFLESVKFVCSWGCQLSTNLFLSDVWACVQGLRIKRLELDGVRKHEDGSTWDISRVCVQCNCGLAWGWLQMLTYRDTGSREILPRHRTFAR